MRVEVDIDIDEVLAETCSIVGPAEGTRSAWVLYLPGEDPCICDTFSDAAAGMREHLRSVRKG